jgi:hypothetical protein
VDAEVPLQVADPQHEFGDGGGARVEFDAEELMRIDGVGLQLQLHVLAELRGEVEHLAFEDFHLLQGDVEEVAAAAGGIEHAEAAELVMEGQDYLLRLLHVGIGGFLLIERRLVVRFGTAAFILMEELSAIDAATAACWAERLA